MTWSRSGRRHPGVDGSRPSRSALPPVAAMLSLADTARACALLAGRKPCVAMFESLLRAYFDVPHVFLLSSGRAAITILLLALRELRDASEVVVPDFTCYTVPSAVAKAGLKIAAVDVDPHHLDYDLTRLSRTLCKDTLAVVAIHPYGVPCRISEMTRICSNSGVPIVEDAAQAMGARVGGRRVGSFGDAAILSFGRGKSMTTITGGAILTSSEAIASAVKSLIEARCVQASPSCRYIALAGGYAIGQRPPLYSLACRLPFVETGVTRFSMDYPIRRMSEAQAALGIVGLSHLEGHNAIRRSNAAYLSEALDGVSGIRLLRSDAGDQGVFLRQAAVFETPQLAETTCRDLAAMGLGCGRSYPGAISSIPEAATLMSTRTEASSNSGDIARRLLTLPTHYLVTKADLELIAATITHQCARSHRKEPSVDR